VGRESEVLKMEIDLREAEPAAVRNPRGESILQRQITMDTIVRHAVFALDGVLQKQVPDTHNKKLFIERAIELLERFLDPSDRPKDDRITN
jgi:hypothetical protein